MTWQVRDPADAYLDSAARATLLEAINALVKHEKPREQVVREQRRNALATFVQVLAVAKPSDSLPPADLAFWRQFAASVAVEAEKQRLSELVKTKVDETWTSSDWFRSNVRDDQMAKNLIWQAREAYPHRKIIVWAASSHLIRDAATAARQLGDRVPAGLYHGLVTMGDGVWKEFGNESYTLAFVGAEGWAGRAGDAPFSLPKLPKLQRGSLEGLLVVAGYENAIVDFRHLDESGAWLRQKLASRPMGYVYWVADWTKVFDGIVFTKTMFPSTLAQRAKLPVIPREQFTEGWTGPKKGAGDYETGLDTTVRHGGERSAHLQSITDEPKGFNALMQTFAADKYQGKRLRMSAYLKTQNVERLAGLYLRIDGSEMTYLALDNMSGRSITGTNDWAKHEIVLDVADNAAEITFGVTYNEKGQVWVDDFKFEIVGSDVAPTAKNVPPRKRQGEMAKDLPKEPMNLDFEQ